MILMDEAVMMGTRVAFNDLTGLRDQNEELQTVIIELEEDSNELMKHIKDATTALFKDDVDVAKGILLAACEADEEHDDAN
jgi:hypothetical protein